MLGVNGSDVLKVLVMGGPRDEGDGEVVCWVYSTENRSRTRVWKTGWERGEKVEKVRS